MIQITEEQFKFICNEFEEKTFGATADLSEESFEVIGCGIDANLEVTAWVYDDDRDTKFSFIWVNLITYIDGEEVPNDFNVRHINSFKKQCS